MNVINISLKMLARQIKNDKISIVMVGFPVFAAIGFYFLVPVISEGLINKYGLQWDLHPYYSMFDAIIVAFSFCTPGFAVTMIMLSELDDKVVSSLCASPLGRNGYLFSRLGLPILISTILAIILCFSLNLAKLSIPIRMALILVSLIACLLPNMVVIAFGKNKVEGVALFKMSFFTTFSIIIPFFVDNWIQWLFSFLPSFWIAKMIKDTNFLFAFPAISTTIIWILPLWKKIIKKMQ